MKLELELGAEAFRVEEMTPNWWDVIPADVALLPPLLMAENFGREIVAEFGVSFTVAKLRYRRHDIVTASA